VKGSREARARRQLVIVTAAVVSGLICPSTWAADAPSAGVDDTAQRALWTEKQVHFTYSGFTTHYSCDGLRDKVRAALLQLGARKDLTVREGACTRPSGGPEPFPNVDVKMNVLQAAPATGDRGSVPAHWRHMELRLDKEPLSEAGDCELVEQIKRTFLPLFATRNVDYQSACIAHQLTPGSTWLRADVLIADSRADAAK
jgi:hypothetical protein